MSHLRRLGKYLFWLVLAAGGAVAVRSVVPVATLQGTNDVGGNFLQTFGGIYGVIVAFTMYVVWQQHIETQTAIEREAVALRELWQVLGFFSTFSQRAHARARLREYAEVVPRMNARKPQQCERSDRDLLQTSHEEFYRHQPASGHEERLYGGALDLFHELNEAREHRVTVSRLRLPNALRWFVYIGGFICVGTLWLVWLESLVVQLLLVAGMTWVIVGMTSIILDLDDPFTGDFVVDWKRFGEAAAVMHPD